MSGVTETQKWSVLLTGGAGYVGSALVPKLLAAGLRLGALKILRGGNAGFRDRTK